MSTYPWHYPTIPSLMCRFRIYHPDPPPLPVTSPAHICKRHNIKTIKLITPPTQHDHFSFTILHRFYMSLILPVSISFLLSSSSTRICHPSVATSVFVREPMHHLLQCFIYSNIAYLLQSYIRQTIIS